MIINIIIKVNVEDLVRFSLQRTNRIYSKLKSNCILRLNKNEFAYFSRVSLKNILGLYSL